MKNDRLLSRGWLKGSAGDDLRVLLSALIGLIVLGQIGYDSPRLSLNTTA